MVYHSVLTDPVPSNEVQSSIVQDTMTRAVTGVATSCHRTGGSITSTWVNPIVSTAERVRSHYAIANAKSRLQTIGYYNTSIVLKLPFPSLHPYFALSRISQ